MAINYPQRYDDDFLNTVKTLIDHVNALGKTIQDLVADGQLTEEQYAELLSVINGLLKSGEVDKDDLNSSLRAEVDKIEGKINKGEASVYDIDKNKGLLDGSFFSTEFIENLQGSNVDVTKVLDASLTRDKFADKAVTPKKTSFADTVVTSRNLHNPETTLNGTILSDQTGEALSNSSYNTTDFISVEANGKIRSSVNSRFAEYDAGQNFIKLTANISILDLTASTHYIRASYPSSAEEYYISNGGAVYREEYKEEVKINNFHMDTETTSKIKKEVSGVAKNIVDNGDFSSDLGWLFNDGVQYSVANNTLTITNYSTGGAQAYRTLNGLIPGHKYYINIQALSNASEDIFYIPQTSTSLSLGSSKYEWRTVSNVVEINDDSIGFQLVRSTRSGDISAKPTKIKTVNFFNLTEIFGQGNEPNVTTLNQLMEYIGGYVDREAGLATTENILHLIDDIKDPPTKNVNWIALGDSITEGSNEYPHRANEKLRFNLTNAGYGGASMAMRNNENESFNPESFVYKSKNTINWQDYDVATILYGTNDWSNDIPLGTIDDSDEYTFMGAMNVGIQKMLTENKTIRTFLITPTFRRNTLVNTNALDLKLEDYVTAVKDIAYKYRLPIIDMWMEAGWNYYNNEALTTDGLHPNNDGQIRMGNIVAHELKELI